MTNDIAIKVEKLGKKYRIGETQAKYHTMRDSVAEIFSGRFRKKIESNGNDGKEFWALKDISFEIKQGEVVGIIGRNGAGKSTLLKTLARITEPTAGYIDIYGRIGSLLEVGTGFHQELTGRENIYLSGSILGMKKDEIERHFDEIVDFAEVEKFIDTPVKHYSSGMYLRLAFGVAAFLQPEILLVDEVLAVGDIGFQNKCLGKMSDVAKQGRTVLFVSHNMSAIQELCQRGILIESGQVAYDGRSADCIMRYSTNAEFFESQKINKADETKPFYVYGLKVNNQISPVVKSDQKLEVSVNIRARDIDNPSIILIVENISGQQIIHSRINSKEIGMAKVNGKLKLSLTLPELWLTSGVYTFYFKFLVSNVGLAGRFDSERIMVEVRGDMDGTSKTILSPKTEWNLSLI